MTTALDIARQLARQGIRETDGKNRSAFIDRINRAVGVPVGSPWCASFVSHCFGEAGASRSQFIRTAGSQAILAWARARNLVFTDPLKLLTVRGALFGWTNPDGNHGHVGFVAGRLTVPVDSGLSSEVPKLLTVAGIKTIEGNTSDRTKSRDGDGAYELTRTMAELGQRRFWFVDTSGIPGGAWWS